MHIKIQGGGKNSGVHANTGSCAALVNYLQHEDADRLAEGKEVFDFFTGQGVRVTPEEVIQKIDRNHRKLCNSDAKFFHIGVSPSPDEIRAMGATDAEIVANATILCQRLTDIYAENYNHDKIRSGKDIMVFFKPHFTREKGNLYEFHIHGIVSRKDIHNQVKLSPMSNHRKTTKGSVLGGFDREVFALRFEKAFDQLFNYQRKVSDTFEYKLAMKQGTVEERTEQVGKLSGEEAKDITSKEAELVMPDITRTIHDSLARRDARRRNEFWNEYHSKYKPKYESLKAACDKSFQLYKTAKERYGVTSQAISDRYTRLRSVYDEMNRRNDDVRRAKTARGIWKAISALVFAMNPVAGILVGLVSRIVTEVNVTAAIQARRALRSEAQEIKADIMTLKEEQAELRQDKSDRLKIYIENKEAKQELQDEINALKAELDKPLQQEESIQTRPKSTFDFKAARQKAASATPVARSKTITSGSMVDLFSIFLAAKDKDSLELALLDMKVVIEPIKDQFSGVADFKVTLAEEGRVVNASDLVSKDRMRQMLDKWEDLTGEIPVNKLEIQRENQRKLADICAKMDTASPEDAPRKPKSISFLPGGMIQITFTTRRGEPSALKVDATGILRFDGLELDINTGKYTQLPIQSQAPHHSRGESREKGKGQGGRRI